ncbi:two-component sensor histidine kinase [Virgisporangium aliadipatigenens]|uniref:histidine kinase n=1 Tax=Virgisporangium aliadipatigenens TaxID=741659 RepID=A0A8J4DQX8_9ACTN|nr:histidine kinase [Virgisporangium aliadipatigenens]GIJ45777.1 two-component sensor histidine kinase [Virgisporangium aliadipatigenens]
MTWTGAEPAEWRHPTGRRRDLLLALGYLVGGLVALRLHMFNDDRGGALAHVVPLAVGCAGLLLRRIAPIPAIAVGLGVLVADLNLGPSLGTILVFTQLLYDAALYGRPWLLTWILRVTIFATAAGLVAAVVVWRSTWGVSVVLQLALILVGPPVTAVPVRRYRSRAHLERERAEQVALLAELDRRHAVAAERTRMARELHDVIANHLSAIALHATAAQSLDLDRAKLTELLGVMRENSVQGLREMRQLVEFLRDPDGTPGEAAQRPRLSDVAALVRTAPGVRARLVETGELPELPVAVDLAAYRIVQESLTNAARHAPGGTVAVTLDPSPERLVVTVDSTAAAAPVNGAGGGGMGLVGMRERATLLGGEFAAGPHGDGWRVRAVLPTGKGVT